MLSNYESSLMDIYQLKYFMTIAECGNITEASKRLHISQPSLSRSLRNLEEELGAQLFDRVGRNIVLNDVGEVALHCTAGALESVGRISAEVTKYQREKQHIVTLFAPVPLGNDETILANFKQRHPDIFVRVGVVRVPQLEDKIPDLMFFASPIVHQESNHLMLGQEEIVLVVSKESPMAKLDSMRLADLRDESWIRSLPGELTDITNSMFLQAGFEPQTIMENQSYIQVMNMVGRGVGLALAPAVTWFTDACDTVKAIPLSDVHRKRYLYLKWPSNVEPSAAAKDLITYLAEYYKQLLA